MTRYYVDADNGSDANNGLGPDSGAATDKPWATLDKFTEAARSSGDRCTLRRGTTAQYDDGTDLSITSDGASDNPLIAEADYEGSSARGLHATDGWNGDSDVFDDSAQTYTMVFGSKTHTASATITGIAAGDWVYNDTDGDDPKEFSYEVGAVSGTTLTLKLPYKGSTGATKTLKRMPPAPIWGDITTTFKVSFSTDYNWLFQGIHFKSKSTSATVSVINTHSFLGKDCIFESTSDVSTKPFSFNIASGMLKKCRFDGGVDNLQFGAGAYMIVDCLGENPTTKAIDVVGAGANVKLIDTEFDTAIEFSGQASNPGANMRLSNVNLNSNAPTGTLTSFSFAGSSDHEGVPGDSVKYSDLNQAGATPVILTQDETTAVRSGGSNTSIKVTPGSAATFSPVWKLSHQLLLEIPIYAGTASKTYEIYLRPVATADWTADPTAAELWIELEAWGHATNNFRKITKSTSVIDMNGSTAYQALSVTVAPAQAGVAFLRLWYAKPKESGKANSFYVDPIPVIS